jgi:hypothetical protein
MADNFWWMAVSTATDTHLVHINFYSETKIEAEVDDQHIANDEPAT